MVQGHPATIMVITHTVPPVQFLNHQGTKLPKDKQFQTQTIPMTAVFLQGCAYSRAWFARIQNFSSISVFEFWLYHNRIYAEIVQVSMLFHKPLFNLRSYQYIFKSLRNNAEKWVWFTVIQWILIGWCIVEWEVKDHPTLHNLYMFHIVVWSQFK